MLSCREIVEQVGSGTLPQEGIVTRSIVRLHIAMCRHCRAYLRGIERNSELARVAAFPADIPTSSKKSEVLRAVAAAAADPRGSGLSP